MTEQYGGPYGTSEGREIRYDVVDGGDESLIHDMGDSNYDTAREGHGQEEGHHRSQSCRNPQHQSPPTVARLRLSLRLTWDRGISADGWQGDNRPHPGVLGHIEADRPSLRLNSPCNSADATETVIGI